MCILGQKNVHREVGTASVLGMCVCIVWRSVVLAISFGQPSRKHSRQTVQYFTVPTFASAMAGKHSLLLLVVSCQSLSGPWRICMTQPPAAADLQAQQNDRHHLLSVRCATSFQDVGSSWRVHVGQVIFRELSVRKREHLISEMPEV